MALLTRPRALVLTSNSHRHRYFIAKIAQLFDVVEVMTEPKQNYFDGPRQESAFVAKHFERLTAAEEEFFASPTRVLPVEISVVPDLNAPELLAHAKVFELEVICLFGTSILKEPWLEAFPNRIVNLHLGLSPFYRGSATLFWPFYYQELECVGATIHLAARKVDAGAILQRIKAAYFPGDDYYTATTRLIRDAIDLFPQVVISYLEGKSQPFAQERIMGRVMKKADFNEAVLREMLEFVGSGLSETQIAKATRSTQCLCLQ